MDTKQAVMSRTNGTGDHKRITERLFDYWQDLCDGRNFPSEAEIDPTIIADIWDSCFLVKVHDAVKSKGYKYNYLGQSIIEAFGDDLTGVEVFNTLVDTNNNVIVKKFAEVVSTGKPVMDESQFTNSHKMVIKYRSCMLPLGHTPDKVDYIIGGMKWKAF